MASLRIAHGQGARCHEIMKSDVTTATSNRPTDFATKAAQHDLPLVRKHRPEAGAGSWRDRAGRYARDERQAARARRTSIRCKSASVRTVALMQVCDTVPPEEVFHEDYTYYASFSTSWLEHSREERAQADRALQAEQEQPGDRAGEQRWLSAEELRRARRAGAGHRSGHRSGEGCAEDRRADDARVLHARTSRRSSPPKGRKRTSFTRTT